MYIYISLKIIRCFSWEKVDFWVFANHPAVYSGGVAGGGSMAVAVGVNYM